MANDYYNATTKVTRQTLARSSTINGILDNIASGFDKLPGEALLNQNKATYAADTGVANTYLVALPATLTSYVPGLLVWVNIANTNTGASTLNIDSLGAKSIKRIDGTNVEATDLTAGDIHGFVYDGINFVLVSSVRTHMAGMASNLGADLVFSGDPAFTGAPDFSGATNKSTILSDLGVVVPEYGTWTPVLSDASSGGNNATITLEGANYAKIGRMVLCNLRLQITSTAGMTSSNDLFITGLPFQNSGGVLQYNRNSGAAVVTNTTFSGAPVFITTNGSSVLKIFDVRSGGILSPLTVAAFGSSKIHGSFTYLTLD